MSGHSRRSFLLGGALTLSAGLTAGLAAGAAGPRSAPLRVAFLTDMHVLPSRECESGFARALESAQSGKPDLLLVGGDAIMDALASPRDDVERQWTTYHRLVRDHCSLPIHHCLGNHDVFGWGRGGSDPAGKTMALDQMALERSYYSFDHGCWRFLVLDSVHPDPARRSGYAARLDLQQVDWLTKELARADRWICVVSHIPIFSACAFFDGPNESSGNWLVPGEWMHLDARLLKDLFAGCPWVKACLSGHIHLEDKVEYLGVSYLCNGSVCGNFWKGGLKDCGPAYAMLELGDDGSVTRRMVSY